MPYVSEFTQFMQSWLEQHPEQQEVKQTGRALWWDKPQDTETQQAFKAAKVPNKAYAYQPE